MSSGDNKYTCLVGSVLRLNEVIYIEQLECHLIYDKHSVQVFVINGCQVLLKKFLLYDSNLNSLLGQLIQLNALIDFPTLIIPRTISY